MRFVGFITAGISLAFISFSKGQPPKQDQRDDMLRWILFANGLTADRNNSILNREIFNKVSGQDFFPFEDVIDKVFKNDEKGDLRQKLGFNWYEPRLTGDGKVEMVSVVSEELPKPNTIVSRSAKRLLLGNSANSTVSRFVLMWNQREGLHKMYGETEPKYILALFSKGRPFDADHILARSHLEGKNSLIEPADLKEGTRTFFSHAPIETHITGDCVRLQLPNMNGNYRYWPKRLNRSDNARKVSEKMGISNITNVLGGHPLKKCFEDQQSQDVWQWSAIPDSDTKRWSQYPPNAWGAEAIKEFIELLLSREHWLYKNAYAFLTHDDVSPEFCVTGIIVAPAKAPDSA